MADKLSLYNAALRLLGESELAALTDQVEKRRVLDQVYGDATLACLEAGMWTFATRTVEADSEPSVEPATGRFHFAFRKPNDFLRVTAVYNGAGEADPLIQYKFEQEYFYADRTPILISYVSDDPQYGMNIGKWPLTFQRYVEAHLAAEIALRITNSQGTHEAMRKLEVIRMRAAENKNVMDQPARFPPMGGWARSRLNGFRGSRINGTGRGL